MTVIDIDEEFQPVWLVLELLLPMEGNARFINQD